MAPVKSIKVELNGELRRFVSPPALTYAHLAARVRSLFSLRDDDDATPTMSYRDEDGDLVRISSDDELALALRLHCEGVIPGATLRLFAAQGGLPAASTATSTAATTGAPHKKKMCVNKLPKNQAKARFVKDVTIEKGQILEPGAQFTKIWRFRNEGTAAWSRGTQLLHLPKNSDNLGGPAVVPLPDGGELRPGQEIDVAVDLTAPTKPGRYIAYYRLYDAQRDKRFGQRVWVEILVVSASSDSDDVAAAAAAAGGSDEWQLLDKDEEKRRRKEAKKEAKKKAKASASAVSSSSEDDDGEAGAGADTAEKPKQVVKVCKKHGKKMVVAVKPASSDDA